MNFNNGFVNIQCERVGKQRMAENIIMRNHDGLSICNKLSYLHMCLASCNLIGISL